jgi:methyltransferase (TIGR00027 family)
MKAGKPSWTARWVATQRAALHDRRPARGDAEAELRLYEDLSVPLLGSRFANPAGMEVRTRFIDDQLVASLDRGVSQVVIIGAGYDGRSLRFKDAPAKWFEVDHPSTQQDKLERLRRTGAPVDHISFIALDLLEDDLGAKLAAAGHDSGSSTFWLCEGLFSYLPRPVIEALCRELRDRSTSESALVCNVLVRTSAVSTSRLVSSGIDRVLAAIGERRLAEFAPGDVEDLLLGTGWRVSENEVTTPSRSDGAYLAAVAAVPD